MTLTLNKISSRDEDSYIANLYHIIVDGENIGSVSTMEDEDSIYIERIDVDEAFRNRGHGTEALRMLSGMASTVYLAPDNEDAQRLYERIGYETYSFPEVDQGFGVYEI